MESDQDVSSEDLESAARDRAARDRADGIYIAQDGFALGWRRRLGASGTPRELGTTPVSLPVG